MELGLVAAELFGESSVEKLTDTNEQQKGYVMKKLLALVAGLFVSVEAGFSGEAVSAVPFELGPQRFNGGDSIVIVQVEASSPLLAVGDKVTVRGQYILKSQEKAHLCLYLTTSESVGAEPVASTQQVDIQKGSGSFELTETVQHPGHLHLSLYPIHAGHRFGTVYFGTGQQMREIHSWKLDD
jgi:hypothetical protein